MSKRPKFEPTVPPPRWLNCPRKGDEFIADKFLAFKTPLSNNFDANVPLESRFTVSMLLNSMKTYNKKIGLVIDLTNTTRFYDPDKELKDNDIKYVKLRCSGHDKTPTEEQAKYFIFTCKTFRSRHPSEIIGVHCTHGFNRTGFMICSYLVEELDFSIDAAIMCFARARPPGIYKQDYINELFKRYASPDDEILQATQHPDWDDKVQKDDGDDGDDGIENGDENNSENFDRPKRRRKEYVKANAEFAAPISGVETVTDLAKLQEIQRTAQEICKWEKAGFPGSQPVSMDVQNLKYLNMRHYKVSWKADGTRYLMLILGRDKVYMLDRDNSVFCVHNLEFPKRKELDKHLENTLLDGEFVFDINPENNEKVPRYLIYDIIQFEGHDVSKLNFADRLNCIGKEIIFARDEGVKQGKIDKSIQPFSVRIKPFYKLNETRKLLSPEFQRQVTHGTDGLIFQPVDEPYRAGTCETTLKWKPPSLNSVDFKLNIRIQNQIGMLPEDCEIGDLYVNGLDTPFATIKLNRNLRKLNQKIIECTWNNNQWEFLRERVDKSYPNAVKTAVSVCESIRNPVTEVKLLEVIDKNLYSLTKEKMPPPPFPAQQSLNRK